MSQKIKLEDLTNELIKGIKTYTEEISNDIYDAVDICTDVLKEDIIDKSPVRKSTANVQSGEYKRSWVRKITRKPNGRVYGTAYNKPHYRLTWLLESGHKARNYSQNKKFINPSPIGGHISPSREEAMETLDNKIKKILE